MPKLRWRKTTGGVLPKGMNVHVGSTVLPQGKFYDPEKIPDQLLVWCRYRGLGRAFRRARDLPPEDQIADLDTMLDEGDPTRFNGEPFILPTTGPRIRKLLFLDDNAGTTSPPIHSSSLASLRIGPNITIAGYGGGIGEAELTTSVDPTIHFTPLLPWIPRGESGSLWDYLDEVAADAATINGEVDQSLASDAVEWIADTLDWALPSELPGRLKLEIKGPIDVDEGASVRIEYSIGFDQSQPFACAFALEAEGYRNDEPVGRTASEVAVFEFNDEDGPSLTVL
jgi:hypothetical protein